MAMNSSTFRSRFTEDATIWQSLKKAITHSSGFQRWKHEQDPASLETMPVDQLVQHYLRETLDTLAY